MPFKIDQVGLSAGISGLARTDGLYNGAEVTLTNTGGGTTEFKLLWVPNGDVDAVATLAAVNGTTWKFTPTAQVFGTYRIQLTTNKGLSNEKVEVRVFRIRTPLRHLCIPALNEVADPNASLENDGAEVVSASEDNAVDYDTAGGYGDFNRDYSGWHRLLEEIALATEAETCPTIVFQPGGIAAGFNVITDIDKLLEVMYALYTVARTSRALLVIDGFYSPSLITITKSINCYFFFDVEFINTQFVLMSMPNESSVFVDPRSKVAATGTRVRFERASSTVRAYMVKFTDLDTCQVWGCRYENMIWGLSSATNIRPMVVQLRRGQAYHQFVNCGFSFNAEDGGNSWQQILWVYDPAPSVLYVDWIGDLAGILVNNSTQQFYTASASTWTTVITYRPGVVSAPSLTWVGRVWSAGTPTIRNLHA